MNKDNLKHDFSKIIVRIPLKTFLLVPFLLQVSSIVGLVAYLSYRSGEQAVRDLANQLMAKVSEQVSDRLDNYLHTPQQIIAFNRLAVEQGDLNLDDISQVQQRLWQQVKIYDVPTALQFVNSQGVFVGVGQDKQGVFSSPGAIILASARDGTRNYYLASETGTPTKLVHSLDNWNLTDRPWYQEAMQQDPNTQTWSSIYAWAGLDWATMNAISPIYQNGEFRGIFAANVILSHINLFLNQLEFAGKGQIFIIESSGNIVATSTKEKPFIKNIDGKNLIRLPAVQSQDWLTRTTALEVMSQTENFTKVKNYKCLQFRAKSAGDKFWQIPPRYLTQVFPYQDEYGLDWLIVLTISETQFMAAIYQNVRHTLIWVSLALVGSIILGIYTSRWISQPIVRLRNSAQAIAEENFTDNHFPPVLVTELQQLTDAFVHMGQRLHHSFQEMNRLNQQLSESQSRLEKFLEAIPVGVAIHTANGALTYINRVAKQLLKSGLIADAAPEKQVTIYQIHVAESDTLYPPEKLPSVQALAGEYVQIDDMVIQRENQRIAIEAQATPVFDTDGNISHAIVAFQDITTRKQSEKIMAEYNDKLERQVREKTQILQQEIADRKRIEHELRVANQQLEQLAQTDGLTQLANRRYFDRYLLQEWQQARREQQPISLILLDIDYFKKFNDTYGHQGGDDCLRQVAQTLKDSIRRSTDLVARYGGEEFVVVLPNTNRGGAVTIAQRIRDYLRSRSIPHQASDVSDVVTVSMGVSIAIPTGDRPESLVKQADDALYQAKDQGRDRYIVVWHQ